MTQNVAESCAAVREKLGRFLDERLPGPEQREVDHHLEDCAECASEREALARTDALVQAALSDHPFDGAATEALLRSLPLERLAALRPAPAAPVHRHGVPGMSLALAAAALLVALGAGLLRDEGATQVDLSTPAPVVARAGNGLLRIGTDGVPQELAPDSPVRAGEGLVAVETPARLFLPDGSRVDLHADSEVTLRADRDGGLTLALTAAEGKVYCEVATRQAPLRVEARGLVVTVLGTRFLVDQGLGAAAVTVIQGRVLAETRVDRRVLGAGDQAEVHYAADRPQLACARVTPRRFGLWVPQLAQEQRAIDHRQAPNGAEAPVPPMRPTQPAAPLPPDEGLDQPFAPPTPPGQPR